MCAVRNWLGPSTARLCRVRNKSSLRDGQSRNGTSTKEKEGRFTAVQVVTVNSVRVDTAGVWLIVVSGLDFCRAEMLKVLSIPNKVP